MVMVRRNKSGSCVMAEALHTEMWTKLEKRLYIICNAPNKTVVNVCTLKNRIFIPAIWSYN